MRQCAEERCKEVFVPSKGSDGKHRFCSPRCAKRDRYWRDPQKHRAQSLRWSRKYREQNREKARIWRLANPGKSRASVNAARLKREYGITAADYEALLVQQGGCCAICCSEPSPDRRLSVDHNHVTGDVRGLLCQSCNSVLGYAYDNPERLRAAAKYLEARDE
jgi:ribosomal protein L24E